MNAEKIKKIINKMYEELSETIIEAKDSLVEEAEEDSANYINVKCECGNNLDYEEDGDDFKLLGKCPNCEKEVDNVKCQCGSYLDFTQESDDAGIDVYLDECTCNDNSQEDRVTEGRYEGKNKSLVISMQQEVISYLVDTYIKEPIRTLSSELLMVNIHKIIDKVEKGE